MTSNTVVVYTYHGGLGTSNHGRVTCVIKIGLVHLRNGDTCGVFLHKNQNEAATRLGSTYGRDMNYNGLAGFGQLSRYDERLLRGELFGTRDILSRIVIIERKIAYAILRKSTKSMLEVTT